MILDFMGCESALDHTNTGKRKINSTSDSILPASLLNFLVVIGTRYKATTSAEW